MRFTTKNPARAAALIGIMTATIEFTKLILASVPNVEAVTLLIASYSFVFGSWGIIASLLFVLIEPLIWGFGTWFLSYLLYWPTLALVFAALGRRGKEVGTIFPAVVAVLLTVWFGILSSLVDVGLFAGVWERFFERFFIYYLRGVPFYALQVITNAVIFPLLFKPITKLLYKIKSRI